MRIGKKDGKSFPIIVTVASGKKEKNFQKGENDMGKINYTLVASFGREVLTAKKNDFADIHKLVEAVLDFGGTIIEIVAEG